jgi:hypothetical protein
MLNLKCKNIVLLVPAFVYTVSIFLVFSNVNLMVVQKENEKCGIERYVEDESKIENKKYSRVTFGEYMHDPCNPEVFVVYYKIDVVCDTFSHALPLNSFFNHSPPVF